MQKLVTVLKPVLRQVLIVMLVGVMSLGSFHSSALAATQVKVNAPDLLYPGENADMTDRPDIGYRTPRSLSQLPNDKQPMLKRSDPDAKILERIGTAFKDASAFLDKTADAASKRPEMQANPAVGQ